MKKALRWGIEPVTSSIMRMLIAHQAITHVFGMLVGCLTYHKLIAGLHLWCQ